VLLDVTSCSFGGRFQRFRRNVTCLPKYTASNPQNSKDYVTDFWGVYDGLSDVCSISLLDVWVINWLAACVDVEMFCYVCS
jgi:hypothetical protein